MEKSELRNRKSTQKNSLSKKSSDDNNEKSHCEDERVERLQNEEPKQEHCKSASTSTKNNRNEVNKVKQYFRSTIDDVAQCLKTDFRFTTDECLRITFEFDVVTVTLFVVAFCTRMYKLSQPNNVV